MDLNTALSLALLTQHLPKSTHTLGRDFAGIQGSRVYNALRDGGLSCRSYRFQKPPIS
jgi:hypothetical protein